VVSNIDRRPVVLGGTAVCDYPEFRRGARPAIPIDMSEPFSDVFNVGMSVLDQWGKQRGVPHATSDYFGALAIAAMVGATARVPFTIDVDWPNAAGAIEVTLRYLPNGFWTQLPAVAVATWLAKEIGLPEPSRDAPDTRAGVLRLTHEFLSRPDPARLLKQALDEMWRALAVPELLDELAKWAEQFAG
jgi:hypothetical protein